MTGFTQASEAVETIGDESFAPALFFDGIRSAYLGGAGEIFFAGRNLHFAQRKNKLIVGLFPQLAGSNANEEGAKAASGKRLGPGSWIGEIALRIVGDD